MKGFGVIGFVMMVIIGAFMLVMVNTFYFEGIEKTFLLMASLMIFLTGFLMSFRELMTR
jgi:ABC-type nickel/cobalt efflux system permease component RcnA